MAGEGQIVGKIGIRVSPRTDRFRQELRAQLEKIEKSIEAAIDVEPNLRGFRERVRAATRNLPKAEVDVEVKRGALNRISQALTSIKAPSFGSGINPAGYAAIFAGITAVAAPLFGLLTTALLTLPGLIAAIATPISAVLLGLDGFKNAAKSLEAPFTSLKETMSAVTEAAFTPVFEQLSKIFPTLAGSLPRVTTGLADMAQAVVDVVTSGPGMAKIESTIQNIGAAISKAAPGIGSFTEGMISLAQSFSEKLPDLSNWFNDTGKAFADWVKKITEDGTLSKAFDGLGSTLKILLDTVGGMLQKGFEFMQDPKNIEDFNNGLKSIGESLESIVNLSNSLNNLGDLFKNLVPTFDSTAFTEDLFAPFTSADAGWRDMFAGIQQAWEATKNSFQASLVVVVGYFATAWNSIRATAAAAFTSIVTSVGSVFSTLTSVIQGVVSNVVGLLGQVPAQVSGAWNAIPGIVAGIWGQVVSAVANAISQVVATVVSGGAQVVAEVSSWPGKIVAAIGNLAATLGEIGRNAASALISGLVGGISAGITAVTGAIGDLLAKARAFFPNSPAKTGPFSGSGWVTHSGEAMMTGLAEGIRKGQASVLAQIQNTTADLAEALKPPTDAGADWKSQIESIGKMPFDFAKSAGEQFTSDLGIGGNGALSQLVKQGMAFGEQVVFNVSSMDDALTGHQRWQNQKAQQYWRR